MRIRDDCIDSLHMGFLAKHFSKPVGGTIYTTYGGDYPDFVTNTCPVAGPLVSVKCDIPAKGIKRYIIRFVLIIENSAGVGTDVLFVYPVSPVNGFNGMANRVSVFDYI